jgi:hypothetical protein
MSGLRPAAPPCASEVGSRCREKCVSVKSGPLRMWFCFAVAIVAAAIADPCVEALSNAGLFGPGRFTDRSNLDVLPALLVGLLCVAMYFVLRVRRELARASGEAIRKRTGRLLVCTYALQLGVLATMETLEQIVVDGHMLGGTVWLGGPVWFALAAHAVACVGVAFVLGTLLRVCARRTVRAIRLIAALVERSVHPPAPIAVSPWEFPTAVHLVLVRCRIGNRAPPVAIV